MSRTLFVTNDFPPRRGGIETFVKQLCDDLPPDEVVVHTASMPGDVEYDADLRYPVVRDPSEVLLPTRAAGQRIERTMQRYACDRVVFGAAAPLGLLAPRLRAAGAIHLTAITHGHEVWWSTLPGFRRAIRGIGDSVDVMTYVSERCRVRIQPALSDEAAARFTLLEPKVDTSRFYPGCGGAEVRERLGIPPDAMVVVCVGRLVRRKGQDTLIKIWPEVQRQFPDSVLLLVGDGSQKRRLKRLARWYGAENAVVFVGSVRLPDVPAHMDAGNVFAMPSRTRLCQLQMEAFGIVYPEARAIGLLVSGDRQGTARSSGPLSEGEAAT